MTIQSCSFYNMFKTDLLDLLSRLFIWSAVDLTRFCCCLPTSMTLASGGNPMFPFVVHQPASLSIWPAVQSLRRGLSTNPGATMWCVCGCSWRDDVCRVCGCYRGGIVVMDVFWRRLCVSMIWGREICLFWAGQGCDEWGGKYLFRAASVWWRCAQYVVIASCG